MARTKNSAEVSVVIPVHNEQDYLEECLKRLLAQTVRAKEIIVVDNASSDSTASIAQAYGVQLIHEPKKGVVWARNRGFDNARSELLVRLDADTLVESNWLEKLVNGLGQYQAASGSAQFYDTALPSMDNWLLKRFFFDWNRYVCGVSSLFGSSMIVRRSLWQKLSRQSFTDKGWEDLDLACRIDEEDKLYLGDLPASISIRSARQPLWRIVFYMWRWPQTFWQRRRYRALAGSLLGLFCLAFAAPFVLSAAHIRPHLKEKLSDIYSRL